MNQCDRCATEKEIDRLPKGWKRLGSETLCGRCLKMAYAIRAVTIPVASPVDGSWKEFGEDLASAWSVTTAITNWAMTQLFVRDARRMSQPKMPPMERIDLYSEVRALWPTFPSSSASALLQAIEKKYRATRYEVIWTAGRSLASAKYPQPFPCVGKRWNLWFEEDGPHVNLLMDTDDKRRELRLRSGARYRRQTELLKKIASGEAIKGECSLYRRKRLADGKPEITTMFKAVAWFPKPAPGKAASGALRVRTDPDRLLVALNDKDETLWNYNADHLGRWIAEHKRDLQRWSEDAKYENRPTPRFAERRRAAADKFGNRMATATHQIAAELVNYAKRRRFASIEYNDSDKGYLPDFQWFALAEKIKQKSDFYGLEFTRKE